MASSKFSRAEAYSAILKEYRELSSLVTPEATPKTRNQTSRVAECLLLLNRLLAAFHPTSVPLLSPGQWIILYYPHNPRFFRGLETLREDTRKADEDRVSRIIANHSAKIDRLRRAFLWSMKEVLKETDSARKSVIISDMEMLGLEWGTCDGRIEMAKRWFNIQWGV